MSYDIKIVNEIATNIEGVFSPPFFDEKQKFNLKII